MVDVELLGSTRTDRTGDIYQEECAGTRRAAGTSGSIRDVNR